MRANQKQNQPHHPDHDVALSLAWELWTWLGEKTRYRDLVEGWIPLILRAKDEQALEWDRMRTIVRWAALENEYTVENLRLSRDPGKSLFKNQWENVVLRFEAWEAAELARARKKWKNGACPRCDKRERNLRSHHGWCNDCEEHWRGTTGQVIEMLEKLAKVGMVRKSERNGDAPPRYFIRQGPDNNSPSAIEGVYSTVGLDGGGWRDLNQEERFEQMAQDIVENNLIETIKGLYEKNKGFQEEEA